MSLDLPRHVWLKRQEEKAEAAAKALSVQPALNIFGSDDFVTSRDVQTQLLQLERYLAKRREEDDSYQLPQPSGWRLCVLMFTLPQVTEGGMHLVSDTLEAKAVTSPQGVVLARGPAAYQDKTRFQEPWCEVGDRIVWKRYDVALFTLANGQHLGFMNDTQPVGIIDRGWEIPQ